ncbi:hypothetical protein G686_04442 [Escherichia coli HVH 6 (3-8296502)]|nr:hypothetical protein G686_04442 [Escherichia coli HVH 6 (3-8296502)]
MSFGQPCDEFPLSSLPPLIRDAVIEAQQITQAPLGLVAASALGAVSLVCQNLIDVCRLNTLRGPVSLFFLTLAESGERKTAVDKLLMKPLYQQEMQLYSRYKSELAVWKNKEELLKAQKKALLSKLNKELRKGADESETLRQLEVLQKNSAEEPVRYKFIFNDATTAAIKNQLCGKWRCVFRSIRSRIGIEVRSAIRIHSINRELNFFYRFLTRFFAAFHYRGIFPQ